MLTSDPDYYYSPESVTQIVAEIIGRTRPASALDSSCGGGALLDAVEQGFAGARCVGIDIDNGAIRRLRQRRPHWTLVEGDALSCKPWQQLRKRSSHQVDVAVLNPPFSMGSSKGIAIHPPQIDRALRCSLAMAHVLTALNRTNPTQVLAILPESLVQSQLDEDARALVLRSYKVEVIRAFKSSTFRGTRANSVLVAMAAAKTRTRHAEEIVTADLPKGLCIVRGGLPNFQARKDANGLPYIHTTALTRLASGEPVGAFPCVAPCGRGEVEGQVVLLPRVGLPKAGNIRSLCLRSPVQLSDCVIALVCDSARQAKMVQQHLHMYMDALTALYAGTGARYVTVERLTTWLCSTLGGNQ
jgi:predicted RNA methylase